jgi:exodeoxyribonuclease VII large subunit
MTEQMTLEQFGRVQERQAVKPMTSTITVAATTTTGVAPTQQPEQQQQQQRQAKTDVKSDILSVTELTKSIKGLLERNFSVAWVKGEISNLKIPSSGHLYFTLKDAGAQVRAVMFKGFAQGLKFRPEDGMEVLVRCRVTVYEPRGDYQLFCEMMDPVGYGALQVAFEKLKARLQAEGLFDSRRKRAIPPFPSRIGIVTSPTGAAIRDMLNILSRRFGGGLDITIISSSVQGDKAPAELAAAINLANKLMRFDVLIVGRGGGSLEDLWAFNTEEVARAVARSIIPTISAVGHEVDFTICDFVADLRAPTPSAAAELVVKNKMDLLDRISLFKRQQTQLIIKRLQLARTSSENLSKRLIDPKRRLQDLVIRCDDWTDRLSQAMHRYFQNANMRVSFFRQRLPSPQRKVDHGRDSVGHLEMRLKSVALQSIQRKTERFGRVTAMLNSFRSGIFYC